MKKQYSNIEFEIVRLKAHDIVTTSYNTESNSASLDFSTNSWDNTGEILGYGVD